MTITDTSSRWGRAASICATAATVAVLAACGSSEPEQGSSNRANHPQREGHRFSGCGPASVAERFESFLAAISARRLTRALEYLARPGALLGVTLYRGAGPRAAEVDAETPGEVYEAFAAAIAEGEPTAVLAVAVGDVAPFAGDYEDKVGARPTAGAEIVARVGADTSLGGKVGIDCEDGRIYLGAMNTRRGLRPQTSCGKRVRFDREEPIVCRL